MSQESTLRADVLTEFLEVAFHSLLYIRNLYPKQIFVLKKKYQIPIRVSKHPKVNEYINECLKTIRYLIQSDSVKDVCLVIEKDEEILERHVFSFDINNTRVADEFLVSVEEIFRQFILKLTVLDSRLKELPKGSSFKIQITTNEQCYVRLNESIEHSHFPWIEVDGPREGSAKDSQHRIFPVKSAECSLFALNVYVES